MDGVVELPAWVMYLWLALVTIGASAVGFLLRRHITKVDGLETDLWKQKQAWGEDHAALRQHLADDYVKKNDLERAMDQMLDFLRRIEDKLDRKVDR